MTIIEIEKKLCYTINKAVTIGLEKKDYYYWRNVLTYLNEYNTKYDSVYQIIIPAVEQLLELINKSGIMHKLSMENIQYIVSNSFLLPLVLANNESKNVKLSNDNSYMFTCQFHNDKKPSFGVTDNKNIAHCFGCNISVNVVSYLRRIENLSFPEAIELLSHIYMFDLKNNSKKLKKISEKYKNIIISDEYLELLKQGQERLIFRKGNNKEIENMYNKRFAMIERIKTNTYDPNFIYIEPPKTLKLTLDQIK